MRKTFMDSRLSSPGPVLQNSNAACKVKEPSTWGSYEGVSHETRIRHGVGRGTRQRLNNVSGSFPTRSTFQPRTVVLKAFKQSFLETHQEMNHSEGGKTNPNVKR